MTADISAILGEIGLSQGEIKVYLALLDLGSSKQIQIIKRSGVASSKLHEILAKLANKGLVTSIVKSGVHYYEASPPARIKDLLQERHERLEALGSSLKDLMPVLEAKKSHGSTSGAEVFQGWSGLYAVYSDLLATLKKGEEFLVLGASKGFDPDKTRSFFTRFNQRAKAKQLRARIVFNKDAMGNVPNALSVAKVRYFSAVTPAEIVIYADKCAIVLLEHEPLVVMMRSKAISESFRSYFAMAWNAAKEA